MITGTNTCACACMCAHVMCVCGVCGGHICYMGLGGWRLGGAQAYRPEHMTDACSVSIV